MYTRCLIYILKQLKNIVVASCGFLFFYANIGQGLFGGLICIGSTCSSTAALAGTQYASSSYYTLNFNDVPSSVVTLLSCLHMGAGDVIAGDVQWLMGNMLYMICVCDMSCINTAKLYKYM